MFTSSELIEALRRRARRSIRPERPPGTFPDGWREWFASMTQRVGAVTGATVEAIVQIMLLREPAPPPRAARELNRWQSFNTLWRQQWHPASRDERGTRIFAMAVTAIVHVFLAIALVWLAYVNFSAGPPATAEGEDIVQVEYIGEGTPVEQGGGPAQGEQPDQAEQAGAASAAASRAEQTPARASEQAAVQPDAAPPPAQAEPQPVQPAPVPADQPLQVSEVAVPDTTFVVPPTTPRLADLAQPQVDVPALRVPTREVVVREIPAPVQAPQRALPQREIAVPELRQRVAEVEVREVAAPLPQVRTRAVAPAVASPELRTQTVRASGREIPMPATTGTGQAASGPPAATGERGASVASGAQSTGAAPTGATPSGGQPSGQSGTQRAGTSRGSGPAATPRPGATASTQRGNDPGASDRNQPGAQRGGRTSGLFNPDGSIRLPSGDGRVGGGLPPGTITEDYEKIDRRGTWLKRPPIDYTPSRFDKLWVPHETLLEEWVRRNVREVLIPVPGTSKKIRCVVSLLQLGGGCGITDPNLQDQEAGARKPPEIPFKRELQEDQNSLED